MDDERILTALIKVEEHLNNAPAVLARLDAIEKMPAARLNEDHVNGLISFSVFWNQTQSSCVRYALMGIGIVGVFIVAVVEFFRRSGGS